MKNFRIVVLGMSLMALASCGDSTDTSEDVSDFSVGGTVSGLSGTLVLQNNGMDDLTLNENGSFTHWWNGCS